MFKTLLACLLVLPVGLQAQSAEIASSSSSLPVADAAASPAPVAMTSPKQETRGGFFHKGIFAPSVKDAPIGTFTASYVYQYAPNYVGANRSLMGWSITPEVNFTSHLGLQAEFTGLYVNGINIQENRLIIAAGPRYNFAPHSRLSPFAFGEAGQIRETSGASRITNWNTLASGGFGVDYKLSRSFSFQLIPGQYIAQVVDDGTWNHSFMTKAGITFNLYK